MEKQNGKFKEKRLRGASGITLIALVITIIVLLILAAVSIATLTGDNGILTKAQNAKEQNDAAEKEETAKLSQAEANMSFEETEYNGVTIPAGMAPTRKEGESTVDEGLVAVDKNGNEWVWIEVPKTEMTSGLTFENETGYSTDDEANCATITADLKAYADPYTKGSATQNENWTDEWYAEDEGTYITESTATPVQKELDTGCGLTLSEYKEAYQKMIKSVYKNGGFWIGRYEAGIDGTTGTDEESLKLGRTSSSGAPRIDDSSPKAISQKNAIPYGWIYCSEAQKLANEMTPDSSKTSSLLFGIQWDLVCKFIEEKEVKKQGESNRTSIIASINSDSGEWGNYSNKLFSVESGKYSMFKPWGGGIDNWQIISSIFQKQAMSYPDIGYTLFSTGITEENKKINIYDFAGNTNEWTLEHAPTTNSPCSIRGGGTSLGSASSSSYHYGQWTDYAFPDCSFRPALY